VNTSFDGDITFALASGRTKASVDAVGIAAADVLAEAVMRAVRAANQGEVHTIIEDASTTMLVAERDNLPP